MNKLKDKVHLDDWDTLIVLDACRYDFFKEYYSIYPNLELGELSIAKSPGSATPEVVPKLFDTDEEWYLYSAHNWLGENVNDITPLNSDDDSWHATRHFDEIDRVKEVNSAGVPGPQLFGQRVIDNIEKINDKRSVVWFMQPHQPNTGNVQVTFGHFFPWGIFMENGKLNSSIQKLIRVGYKFNLLSAMYSLSNIVGELDGKTVITSDHGELLFDNTAKPEDFGHPHSRDDAVLRNVPWLSIDSNKALNPMRVSDGEYVRLVYRTVLGREPENEGLSRYTEALKSENERVTRQSLILILLQSDEYRDVFGNPNEICGISGRVSGNADYNKTELGISNVTEDVLDALGYK